MGQATFDELLDAIEHLPADEQADLVDVVQRRLAERGHRRVLDEAAQARDAFANGTAKPSTAADIMREIES